MKRATSVLGAVIALMFCVNVAGARAEILTYKMQDEIAGTAVYYVEIRSQNYSSYTNESTITFSCDSTGTMQMFWRVGGRYTRKTVMVMTYKVDSHEPVMLKINTGTPQVAEGQPPEVRDLIAQFSKGTVLIAR